MAGGVIACVFSNAPVSLREYVKRLFEAEGISVEMERAPDKDGLVIAEINAEIGVLVTQAEKIGLGKQTVDGDVIPFVAAEKEKFAAESPDTLFSEAERIMLIWQIIHTVYPNEADFEDVRPRENIINWLRRNGHLEDCFPLHNEKTLESLLGDLSIKRPWLSDDLIIRIRDYFGDRVALYFAFMATYTSCLMTYAAVGGSVYLLGLIPQLHAQVHFLFSIFCAAWSTWTLQRWYRRNMKLIHEWRGIVIDDSTDEALFDKRQIEDFRPEFVGEERIDEVTGRMRPFAPEEDQRRRRQFSNGVTLAYFLVTVLIIFGCFSLEDDVKRWLADEDDEFGSLKVFPLSLVIQNLPLILFMASTTILGLIFTKLASNLTDYENHLLRRKHAKQLTRKLTGFQFFNTFAVFLYIAFIRRDETMLKMRVFNLFIIDLLIGNITETIIPLATRAIGRIENERTTVEEEERAQQLSAPTASTDPTAPNGEETPEPKETMTAKVKRYTSKPFVSEVVRSVKHDLAVTTERDADLSFASARDQLKLGDAEDNTDDDYFEMFKQFGLVTLFAVVWPVGPIYAMLNNCVEIYTDFVKISRNLKRPVPSREITIGAWFDAMETLSLFAFITNLLIFFHTTSDGDLFFQSNSTHRYLMVIFIQQIMLVARAAYVHTTKKVPENITSRTARRGYALGL